ncbi:16S rRNA (guanine(966)-N(2))-methyltransferase RsmD [Polaromonas sp.]|uniref:16S rRNA (guanine(966)-N(2))-methyltransferase RsmD n=1 Tax=Polaromonas sp. TaxID=1869339 RepID=UPI002C381D77|nr:16S rRNA (guanine(966)-N(2))-methyltransferase RsmD [Polaromonas sp.]HQS33270.1 16S rRNA (guanine(966)-N(2))-methyltransferase RsmD [Polaromonas sp.]HQS90868.1 16S rRNA (guanine(966)-N(2))-methyltransferase RsmD [Polaromonas sp.]
MKIFPPPSASSAAKPAEKAARAPGARSPALPKGKPHAKLPGEIRIVGGQYKRTKIPVPNREGLRPTPDRVRETLFNWLGQDLNGWRCADVFAGTGALGFEAASRGAADVLLCEQDAALMAPLQALKTRLKADMVRIERGDGLSALRRLSAGSMHLVLLDPPFESSVFEPALKAAAEALAPAGLVYLEAPRAWANDELLPLGLQVYRSGKAGAVHFHLLVKAEAAAPAADNAPAA